MDLINLIPYVGMVMNAAQQTAGELAPTASQWATSGASTVVTLGAARAILKLAIWDRIVEETATRWDDYALKLARQVLAILAIKPGDKKKRLPVNR